MNGVALASNGHCRRDLGTGLDRAPGWSRRRPRARRRGVDALQFRDAPDVDEVFEDGEPEREHRDEALSTGQHLRAVAELGEELHRFCDGSRRVILERRGLHRC